MVFGPQCSAFLHSAFSFTGMHILTGIPDASRTWKDAEVVTAEVVTALLAAPADEGALPDFPYLSWNSSKGKGPFLI